jgi:hypothetical protein
MVLWASTRLSLHHHWQADTNPAPSLEDLEQQATNKMIDEVMAQIIGTNRGVVIHRSLPT